MFQFNQWLSCKDGETIAAEVSATKTEVVNNNDFPGMSKWLLSYDFDIRFAIGGLVPAN